MPVYSVNRRRAIVLLVLSSVLLITLDLRGNPLIDRLRSAFSDVLTPFETAGDVIATPIRNAWHGATDYQDLKRQNDELRDEIAQQRGDQLAARASFSDLQDLLALNGLVANYLRVTARVIGPSPGNFDQTVEIDRGSADGIVEGMAVVNPAGLVGKITHVYGNRSVVLLITDRTYAIECKVSAQPVTPPADASSTTVNTTPSGVNPSDLLTTTTTIAPTTTTTVPFGAQPGAPTASTVAVDPSATSTTTAPTTTTIKPVPAPRETGGCEGRGAGALPAMRFVTENPVFGGFGPGDVITTTGGSKSLAPPDLIIGTVINKVKRTVSEGPLLEIKLAADLDHLNFVQVVLYRPPAEVAGG